MRRLARPIVITAAVLVAALAALLVVVMSSQGETSSGPPWAGDLKQCRANPMSHVHDPSRLEFLQTCSTVSGEVRSVRFVSAFDDVQITLVPDQKLRSYLPSANKGVLVADVIATDQAKVHAPEPGSRITAWGAWALDKATKKALLLPAYRIVTTRANRSIVTGHSYEKHGPAIKKQLQLSVDVARRVAVGGRINVDIRARWLRAGISIPASEIRLFIEMTTPNGVGVRWKAAMTDTLGVATLHLVAIQVPASYTLTVYATPSKLPVSVQAPVHVARR